MNSRYLKGNFAVPAPSRRRGRRLYHSASTEVSWGERFRGSVVTSALTEDVALLIVFGSLPQRSLARARAGRLRPPFFDELIRELWQAPNSSEAPLRRRPAATTAPVRGQPHKTNDVA
jgi:hypothetical protein